MIRDDTNIGKQSNPHWDAKKDEAVTKACLLLVDTIQEFS
jgi:hypothetical protein